MNAKQQFKAAYSAARKNRDALSYDSAEYWTSAGVPALNSEAYEFHLSKKLSGNKNYSAIAAVARIMCAIELPKTTPAQRLARELDTYEYN